MRGEELHAAEVAVFDLEAIAGDSGNGVGEEERTGGEADVEAGIFGFDLAEVDGGDAVGGGAEVKRGDAEDDGGDFGLFFGDGGELTLGEIAGEGEDAGAIADAGEEAGGEGMDIDAGDLGGGDIGAGVHVEGRDGFSVGGADFGAGEEAAVFEDDAAGFGVGWVGFDDVAEGRGRDVRGIEGGEEEIVQGDGDGGGTCRSDDGEGRGRRGRDFAFVDFAIEGPEDAGVRHGGKGGEEDKWEKG